MECLPRLGEEVPGPGSDHLPAGQAGGGSQAFVLHQVLGNGEPDLFYLYVFTPRHNMFSLDLFNGATLKTEEALARELAPRLDAESR